MKEILRRVTTWSCRDVAMGMVVVLFIGSLIASFNIVESIERSHRTEMEGAHEIAHKYMELQVQNLELMSELENCKAKLRYEMPVDIQEPLPYVVNN